MSSGQSYAELSDIWLCLACALGWTVWLVNSRQYLLKTDREGTIFDQEESVKVVGNVLSMKVGEDQDGTGIPVYLVLVDYVVACYDPTQTEVTDTVRNTGNRIQNKLARRSSRYLD